MSIKAPLIPPDILSNPTAYRETDWRHPDIDVEALEADLRRHVMGEVRFDAGSKAMYAVDASNYRQVPIGVVIPRTIDDVIATVAVARQYNAPILSRGGGTSLAGECCNYAVVMDWTKYLSKVLEINAQERYARVYPGTICDELRKPAQKYGLIWGPDPATHNHCTFGGMLGNNSCGAHAQMAGKAVDNTEELDVLLYDGTRMTVGWMSEKDLEREIAKGGRTGQIYRNLRSLREHYAGLIKDRYPKIPRRVSGYNLDSLLPHPDGRFNVARTLVGSEGTLVTILQAKVRLVDARPKRVIVVLGYPDVYHAADHLMEVLEFNPIALEGLDELLIDNLKKKGSPHASYIDLLPEGKGWLMVEFGADTQEEALHQAHGLMDKLKKKSDAPSMNLLVDAEKREHMWTLRESGLGATAFVPGQPLTWPGWEDSAVAPEHVGAYLRDLRALYDKYGYIAALYGHFGQGCIHCRVSFDVTSESGLTNFRRFMDEATTLITTKYHGSLSGEHGDGQARAEFLYKMFGEDIVQAFREFKAIWDPDWKMNPGKVVDPYRITDNLRLGASYPQKMWQPETHFKFPDDHGDFNHAVLRCVGVGKCRRKEGKTALDNTMCPSYMVTLEEADTTRGRAHQLWEMLHGDVVTEGWKSENVKGALDLCLACKGCKGDCPVNVDMATYKAEFLSHYWEGRLRPASAYAFGWIDKWSRIAQHVPGLANLFTQTPGLSAIAKAVVGIPQQRHIPPFAVHTFKSWFGKHEPRNTDPNAPRVILFGDTFNNFFMPETSQAAVNVLEHAGFNVQVPMQHLCCGRPLYDYGFLDMAKRYLERVLEALRPEIEAGTPMVVLEPSCCSVFRDEMHSLMPENPLAAKLRDQTLTLSEFLTRKAPDYEIPKLKRRALVQAHCHHKAIMRLEPEAAVMDKMGLDYKIPESGCCGMAGSFGYEKDKYDVSLACGERVLLPEVRKAGLATMIIADGFSCKEQIAQETPRRALHLAEVLDTAINDGRYGSDTMYPERRFVEPRERQVKRSMIRAGLVLGAGVAGLALAFTMWRKRAA